MRVLEAVPAWVVGQIAKSEVRTLVDDRRPSREEARGQIGGGAVGEGQEDGIHRRQLVMDRQCGRAQVGMDAGDRIVVALAALQANEVHIRVPRQEPDEFGTHIPGGADDPHADASRSTRRVQPALRSGDEP